MSPGAAAPTGTVAFHAVYADGSEVTLGDGTLDSNGTAVFQMPSGLAVGIVGIYAVYLGDANFAGSSSPPTTQVVNQAATTLQLTSSLSYIFPGESFTLTETLFTGTPGTFATPPTGTITVYDTYNGVTTVLFTGAWGSQETFPALTAVGDHVLTAVYSGDGNFLGSTSPSITVTVVSLT
jgi:hypothetical protein